MVWIFLRLNKQLILDMSSTKTATWTMIANVKGPDLSTIVQQWGRCSNLPSQVKFCMLCKSTAVICMEVCSGTCLVTKLDSFTDAGTRVWNCVGMFREVPTHTLSIISWPLNLELSDSKWCLDMLGSTNPCWTVQAGKLPQCQGWLVGILALTQEATYTTLLRKLVLIFTEKPHQD